MLDPPQQSIMKHPISHKFLNCILDILSNILRLLKLRSSELLRYLAMQFMSLSHGL
jgi:hypothetical protein